MPISPIMLLHHTHTDIGYTNPQSVFWHLSREFIDQAIDQCEATADLAEPARMRWTCEVTSTVMDWLTHAPEKQIERVRSLVQAGQFAFGAMWCHWSATIREDSFFDSLMPVRRIREVLGAPVKVAITHDVNGLPWSAVEMLLDAGVEGLLMGVNIHMGGFPLTRPMAFNWVGASGRSIPVFSGEHYNTFNRIAKPQLRDLDSAQVGIDKYLHRLQSQGYVLPFAFLTATHPFCDDNNPPYPELPQFIRRWNEQGRSPQISLVTPETLFQRLRDLPLSMMPSHSGDWTDYWTSGSGSSAMELAASREANATLRDARLLSVTLIQATQSNKIMEDRTVHQLAIADEHTFGAFCSTAGLQSTTLYEPLTVAEQWYPKGAAMVASLSDARMLRREVMNLAAKNPVNFDQVQGLLLVNAAQVSRRVCVRVPKHICSGTAPMFNTNLHKLDVLYSFDDDRYAGWVGPIDMPPMSARNIPLADLTPAVVATDMQCTSAILESKWYTLSVDPLNGRILSLIDRSSGLELADNQSKYGIFDAVTESIASQSEASVRLTDPRINLYSASLESFDRVHEDQDCWVHNWNAHREAAKVLRPTTTVTPVGAVLKREVLCPGVNGPMVQTITLSAHEPRIIFEAYFNKADVHDPDALYFAFPFGVPNAQAWFDTAGQAVAFDHQQLPGSCRDWVTADSYVAVASETLCLVLACPDAPLFQIGGLNFGRGVQSSGGLNQATLFAWPMNNYWNTNYRVSQPGFIRLRYELTTCPTFDAAQAARFGDAAAHKVAWHPMSACSHDETKVLMQLNDKAITLVQIKRAANDNQIVVRLRNHSERHVETLFKLPTIAIRSAYLGDSLERLGTELPVRGGRIAVCIPPRSVVSILINQEL